MVLTQALHTVQSSGDYYRAVGRSENLGVPVVIWWALAVMEAKPSYFNDLILLLTHPPSFFNLPPVLLYMLTSTSKDKNPP